MLICCSALLSFSWQWHNHLSISATLCPVSCHHCTHFISSFKSNITHNHSIFTVFILLTEMGMEILTAECRVILSRPLCWVVRWREVDDWRAIYGITYSVEGVGKRGPLKAESLNTMPHIHRHKETTHTHTHTHTDTHRQWIRIGIMEA